MCKFNLVQEVVLNFIYIIILIFLSPFFSPREDLEGGGGVKDVSCSKTVWSLRKILYHLGRVQNSSAAWIYVYLLFSIIKIFFTNFLNLGWNCIMRFILTEWLSVYWSRWIWNIENCCIFFFCGFFLGGGGLGLPSLWRLVSKMKQVHPGYCTWQLTINKIKFIYLNCSCYGTCNLQIGVCQCQDLRILFRGLGPLKPQIEKIICKCNPDYIWWIEIICKCF